MKKLVSVPLATSTEEQDPNYGEIPIAALVREPLDNVIHVIINHEIPRLRGCSRNCVSQVGE